MEIFLVGGAVRDKLLGLEVKDRDWVVVGATPAQMEALRYRRVGKDFPVFLHPQTHEEYALARTERKTGPGYQGFEFHATPEVTLEHDLRRRDLTINAMAESLDGTLIDPFGGRKDLRNRIFRHVSSAFAEDPVRILRLARFSTRHYLHGFQVHPTTNDLMRKMVANGEVDALVPERVWTELQSALNEAHPQRFFAVLRNCGALARILPEIEHLFGVPQTVTHHPEVDTGEHTMMVLEQACRLTRDPCVRFAALVHDLGKGITPREQWPQHIGHEKRGVPLVQELCRRLAIPKEYRDLAVLVTRHHCDYQRAAELRPATLWRILEALDALRRPRRFEQFLLACEADSRGRKGYQDRDCPQARILQAAFDAAVPIDSKPLLALGLRGQAIGEELRKLRIKAIGQALRDIS